MKRIFIFAFSILSIAGCNSVGLGDGEKNACQFLMEQSDELRDIREDIGEVVVVGEKTVLVDRLMKDGNRNFSKYGKDFITGNFSLDDFLPIIDSVEVVVKDINASWGNNKEAIDSLRKLDKYNGCWRKIYNVQVIMKSGAKKDPVGVLMDEDGITPNALESKYQEDINNYGEEIQMLRNYMNNPEQAY